MKKLLPLSVFCFLLVNQVAAQNKSDREAAGLSGSVHTIRTERAKLWKGSSGEYIDLYKYGGQTITYDEQGKMLNEDPPTPGCGYSDNLKRVKKTDAEGREVEGTEYLPNGRLFRRTTYAYDLNGNQTEVASYDHRNILEFEWVRVYDANGRELEATRYDRNGTHQGRLDHKRVYGYDEKGNKTDEIWYDPRGKLLHWWTDVYEYDSQKNWIKQLFYKRVEDGKELPFEPSEAAYRTITYY